MDCVLVGSSLSDSSSEGTAFVFLFVDAEDDGFLDKALRVSISALIASALRVTGAVAHPGIYGECSRSS